MRFDYVMPAQGPVVEGLEESEKIYALEQPEYLPIRTLKGEHGLSAIYRCELSAHQRVMIAEGADILVEILHLNGPLAPSRVMLLNQQGLDEGEAHDLAQWFCAQAKILP